MFRPPSTIHIKRKATDDPVDVLRVHELNGKRQRRATEFVFTRQAPDASISAHDGLAPAVSPAHSTRPIKPLPHSGGRASLRAAPETSAGSTTSHTHKETTQLVNKPSSHLDLEDEPEITQLQFAQRRRFHISRTSSSQGRQSPVIGGKIQKRTPTVFVERRPQPSISNEERPPTPTETRTLSTTTLTTVDAPRPQKKPGLAARTTSKSTLHSSAQLATPTTISQSRNVSLPSGLVTPWDVTSEQLAKELEAYTLEEIGRNIAESGSTKPKARLVAEVQTMAKTQPKPVAQRDLDSQVWPEHILSATSSASPRIKKLASTKFKPKVPALRYFERHPEEAARFEAEAKARAAVAAATAPTPKGGDRDQADDDGDYVIDTYVRVPAEEVKIADEDDFGYLVLEAGDENEFYGEAFDNQVDEEYDEDDENAENHYTADYPDEEMESDDEFNRDPYKYRDGNASEKEEYDQNDYDEKDDDETTRYPWLKPSYMKNDELEDDDEDDELYDVNDNEAEVVGYIEDGDEENEDSEEEKVKMKEDKDAHDMKGLNSDAKAKVQAAKKDGLVAAFPQYPKH